MKKITILTALIFTFCFAANAQNETIKTYYKSGNLEGYSTYKNDKLNGNIIFFFDTPDEIMKTSIAYKDGIREGKYQEFFNNSRDFKFRILFEVNYIEDKRQGTVKSYYESGKLKGNGNFKDDKLNGKYTEYYETGEEYKIQNYKSGVLDGSVLQYWETGNLKSEVKYVNGKPDGEHYYYNEKDKIETITNYKNGEIIGRPISIDRKEEGIKTQNIIRNKETIIYKTYYANGKLKSETPYEKGKINGIKKSYTKNGIIESENTYVKDSLNGITIIYSFGNKGEVIQYINGNKEGISKYYYFGTEIVQFEIPYVKGKINGLRKNYFNNGNLRSQTNYINDKPNGKYTGYYISGKMEEESSFIDGQENGLKKKYYENGTVESEVNYARGKKKRHSEILLSKRKTKSRNNI